MLRPHKKRSNEGTSLPELLIVMACVAIIASLTIPQSTMVHKAYLQAEVLKLKSIILYLQKKAQIKNKAFCITCDPQANCYWHEGVQEKLNPHLCFGYLDDTMGPPASPTTKLTQPITFINNTITLHPDGTISSGSIYCITKNKKAMASLTSGVGDISYLRTYLWSMDGWKLL